MKTSEILTQDGQQSSVNQCQEQNDSLKALVSLIIPCRNEERFIGKCLDSVISNLRSDADIEVLVVDGMSEDQTRTIVKGYSVRYPFIKLLDNPKKIVPTAMNAGIAHARGQIIIRMDAHTTYSPDYIQKCVRYLEDPKINNVGGVWVTVPGNESIKAKSIALALSHPFGVGNSLFRIGLKEPTLVDTVPFGCYRKEIFEKIGMYNENLVRNQDIELNLRLKSMGGQILLVPDIISYYHARSTINALASNNFWNGFWVIYSRRFTSFCFSIRHIIPLLFVLSLLISLCSAVFYGPFLYLFILISGMYFFCNAFFSSVLSWKKGIRYFPGLMASFAALHFSYGLGSLWGVIKTYIFRS